ncbi:MAG: putative integral rane protein, partial [Pseudonocardiales bacterium]|nr:putative integral rane protein [Pseudonocardiales bacterium]
MVEPDPATPASTRRSSVLRGLLLLICVGVAAWALIGHWSDFRVDLAQLGWAHALLSVPPMLLGLVSGMLAWRAILSSLGSPIPAAAAVRIYFIGQLGKYVPGSMWPVVAQMELGRDFQIPRRRSVVALTMAIVTSLATGAISACIAIPF